jgi:hypothetical protein
MTLTDKQKLKRFLLNARHETQSLEELMTDCGITFEDLSAWAGTRSFKRLRDRMARAAAVLREMDIVRSAKHAAVQLQKVVAVDAKAPEYHDALRKLWIDTIKLARANESVRRRAKAAQEEPLREPIISPLVPPDEALVLLERLKKRTSSIHHDGHEARAVDA